jgi:two-component system response regulator YesN
VADFFLKPIDEQVLTDTIRKQVAAMERQKESEYHELTTRRAQGTAEQLELEKIMKKLIHNKIEHANVVNNLFIKYQYDKEQSLQVAILVPELYLKEKAGEENFTALSIKNICIGMIDAQNAGITFMDDDGKIVMVFFDKGNENEIVEQIIQLNNILKDEYNINPKVVMGSVVKGFFNLMISYNDAIYLLSHEKESIREIVQSYQSQNKADIFKDIYQELIATMIANVANMEYVLRIFETFIRATESYNLTVNYIRKCCFDIASSVYFSYLSDSGANMDNRLNELIKALIHADKEEALEVTKSFYHKFPVMKN